MIRPALFLLLTTTPALAQTIGPDGIKAGGVVIDSRGVRTGDATIDANGVDANGVRDRGDAVISTNRNTRAVSCKGGRLVVNGNGNVLSVSNCSTVQVAGNANRINITFGMRGSLAVVGNRDTVSWSAPRGAAIAVSNVGTGNSLARR